MLIQGYYPHVGGAERQLASLAPRLAALDLAVTVFTRRTGNLLPFEVIEGVPVHRLPIPGTRAGRSISYTAHALNHIRKLRPDVIHAHDLFSPSTTGLLARKLFNIPLVVKVVRGGHLGDLQWLGRRAFGRSRVNALCKNVDRFITISGEINDELASLGVEGERRAFIPNGVDSERFSPCRPEEKPGIREHLKLPNGPIVIYAGRLAEEKRVKDLVDIWPTVCEHYPDATLLIVGSGDQESALKANNTPHVMFTGPVADVAPYLKAADVFVLPSVAEGLSNALLEGMASGLPCIATDVGGAQELITSEESGLLIPPRAPDVLLDKILALLHDKPRQSSMGASARQFVAENFSLEYVAQGLHQVYHEVRHEHRS